MTNAILQFLLNNLKAGNSSNGVITELLKERKAALQMNSKVGAHDPSVAGVCTQRRKRSVVLQWIRQL
jgi:hypothetical protein